jgi:cysteine synthase
MIEACGVSGPKRHGTHSHQHTRHGLSVSLTAGDRGHSVHVVEDGSLEGKQRQHLHELGATVLHSNGIAANSPANSPVAVWLTDKAKGMASLYG